MAGSGEIYLLCSNKSDISAFQQRRHRIVTRFIFVLLLLIELRWSQFMLMVYSPHRRDKLLFLTPCFFFFFSPPEFSSLATWMAATTLTASLWGECLTSSLLLSCHHLPFFLLLLPHVTSCQPLIKVCAALSSQPLPLREAHLCRSQLQQLGCHFCF